VSSTGVGGEDGPPGGSAEESALRCVAAAIDQLEADRRLTDAVGLEARVAAIWSMVSELDPQLVRLVAGYRSTAG
jgi:hypothetical protein